MSNRDVFSPSNGSQVSTVFLIEQGGHGGTTSQQARDNLQVFGTDEIGQPNGLAPLVNSQIPEIHMDSQVTGMAGIIGPTTVSKNSMVEYGFVSYDSFRSIPCSAQRGTVEISDGKLIYTAPATTGSDVIIVGNRNFPITVADSLPAAVIDSILIKDSGSGSFLISMDVTLKGMGENVPTGWIIDVYKQGVVPATINSSSVVSFAGKSVNFTLTDSQLPRGSSDFVMRMISSGTELSQTKGRLSRQGSS